MKRKNWRWSGKWKIESGKWKVENFFGGNWKYYNFFLRILGKNIIFAPIF